MMAEVVSVVMKDELHKLVEELPAQKAEMAYRVLEMLLLSEEEATPEELADIEAAEAEIARGEWVSLDELKRKLGL